MTVAKLICVSGVVYFNDLAGIAASRISRRTGHLQIRSFGSRYGFRHPSRCDSRGSVLRESGLVRRVLPLYIIVATGRDCAALRGAGCRSVVDFVDHAKHFVTRKAAHFEPLVQPTGNIVMCFIVSIPRPECRCLEGRECSQSEQCWRCFHEPANPR